ncbi:hypothetical protein SFC55_20235 [Niallia taxi]|uniref:lipopolysaccharide biosynthesis protein n=1 Tax=Niallia taxi TaxID=2499688 RepID=UPI00398272BD
MKLSNPSNNSFTSNFVKTFQSEILFILVTTLSGIVLARYLGPTGRGQYIAITMWSTLISWYLNCNVYLTVIYYWKNLTDERHDFIKTLFVTGFMLGGIGCAVGEFLIIPKMFGEVNTQTLTAIRIFFLALTLGIACDVILGALAAENRFNFVNITRILNPLFVTCGMVVLSIFNSLNVASALYILFSVYTAIAISTFIYGYRNGYLKGKVRFKLLFTLWYGVKAQGGTIADATAGNASTMILSLMLPPAALGYYSTARSSVGPLSSASKAIQRVSFPKLTGISSEKINDRTMNLWRKSLLLNVIIAIPFTLCLPFLIPLLFGLEYKLSIVPAVILILFILIEGQTMIFRNAVNGSGKTIVNTTTEVISAVFIITTLLLTVSHWGVIGAAIVTVISALLKLIIYIYEYNRSVKKVVWKQFLPTVEDFGFLLNSFRSLSLRVFRLFLRKRAFK